MKQYSYQDILNSIAPGGGSVELKNPSTGEVIAAISYDSADDVAAAVDAAATAQRSWGALTHAERCEYLVRCAEAIEDNAETLAELLSREQGKPLNGPNARFEVGACAAWLRATAAIPVEETEVVNDGDTFATLAYRPIGVVGAIGPWNWPMMITTWQVAPALRMGNGVVVKPSEYTPLSVAALVRVLNDVLPEGVLSIVVGDGAIGAELTTNPRVGKIMFTGSTATGKKIAATAAGDVKRLTLELGGNDAGIVLDDVDPRAIAEDLFWGAFINTGQTCAALKRLYVPGSIYDDVVEALAEVATAMPMGDGLDEQSVLGPLQNKAQFDIVKELVRAAVDGGARVVVGGDPDEDQPGYFYPTTLVADIAPDNPLVVKEQFGPALPIVRYDDLDWAIEQANALDFGLGGSVWSADRERAREVAARIQAGTVWINSHGGVDPRIPFGGTKGSGYGVEFGELGLKELAVAQVING
ncbi:aldehyde dehydrogenase family protein [Trueperella abortisuis]|uniref:Acyl-CoA reductase-like NAD-dependent aldehyde dehydrogenase n=1 Tax=Trueperella abortisuis TaxID=445930 RepID=A0ABT9PKF8_9ACTO|nr:aldehyde dehydrogenase family protein [Trueperella abortisuis]MDP9833213.1 acyl-CoA reductase-like NAD-dependent aldehyde dehydrogenase [Trueperella abortisuis]